MFWNKCRRHKTALKTGTAPILYGLLRPPTEYEHTRRRHFPRAASWVPGGCDVHFPVRALVKYCDRCREAEREWHMEHPEDSVGPIAVPALQIEDPGENVSRVVELLQESFFLPAEYAKRVANGGGEVLASLVDKNDRTLRSLLEEAGARVREVKVTAGP